MMKRENKLRVFGGFILLFNLWFIGSYSIGGVPALLLTFGFAVGYEYLVVRKVSQIIEKAPSERPLSPIDMAVDKELDISLLNSGEIAAQEKQGQRLSNIPRPSLVKCILTGAAVGVIAFVVFGFISSVTKSSQINFDIFTFGFFTVAGVAIGAVSFRR